MAFTMSWSLRCNASDNVFVALKNSQLEMQIKEKSKDWKYTKDLMLHLYFAYLCHPIQQPLALQLL